MKNKSCRMLKYINTAKIFLILFLIYSCQEQDDVAYSDPTISFKVSPQFVYNDSSISVGKQFIIGIEAQSNGHNKLTNFIAKVNGERYLDLGFYTDTFSKDIQITKGLDLTEDWEFIIRDIEGNSSSIGLTISKNDIVEFGEINTYLNVFLGAQNSTLYGSFMSLTNGSVYDLQGAFNNSALVDIVYYYDDFDKLEKCVMASPGANIGETAFPGEYAIVNWETINTTRYSREKLMLTSQEFDIATNDSILIANTFAFETGGRKAKLLQPGYMYSFVRNNKTGIFKVVSTSESNSGFMVVDIKIQK